MEDEQYIRLMQLRKLALFQGNEALAWELWEAAVKLLEADLVSEDAAQAAAIL